MAIHAIRVRTTDGWQDLALVGPPGPPGPPGATGSGAGNVVGPAGAVADRIAVYSGTSGTVIKDGGVTIAGLGIPAPASVAPLINGIAAVGVSLLYARQDHVHPFDTSRASVTYVDAQDALKANVASPTFTGDPKAPTPAAGDNDTSIATTAFVTAALATGGGSGPSPATVSPLMDGVAAVGTTTKYAREDHRHPSDTSLAPLASPAFTGTPTTPTAAPTTSTTQVASTAFVTAAVAASGSGSDTGEWNFIATTTAPPATGQIRLDNVTQASATHMYVSNITATSVDVSAVLKFLVKSGSRLLLQDKDDSTKYVIYTASADATIASGYVDIPLTFVEQGGAIPAQRCLLSVASGGGGGGALPATVAPLMDGVATVGTTTKYAREDHIHPSDTAKASLASPVFTGNPMAPTPTAGDNDTSIATTAFVATAVAAAPNMLSSTWLAGANPNNSTIFVAARALTIVSLVGVADTANGAAATVSIVKAASGTALSAGTVIHSGSFNANGAANVNQTLTLTTTAMASGDRLGIVTTGTFTNSVASITVMVK